MYIDLIEDKLRQIEAEIDANNTELK